MKVRIIANPVAGGGKGKLRAEGLCRALEELGVSVDLFFTARAGDGREAAGKGGVDCVAVVGGDGSINEVLNGLTDFNTALAILPSGTANVVARELGIIKEPEAVAKWIVDGCRHSMDVGLCGNRRFLLGVGAGLDAAIAARVSAQRGHKSGLSKWIWPTLHQCFTYTFPGINVKVDGNLVGENYHYAVVGNCRHSAGIFKLSPKASIDDGLLDICLFRDLNVFRLASLSLAVLRPDFINRKDVTYLQGREIELTAADNGAVPLQIDGDPAGFVPVQIGVLPDKIQVVAPPSAP
jgi:YegS/Rv2252/BmrU family lipid kinase